MAEAGPSVFQNEVDAVLLGVVLGEESFLHDLDGLLILWAVHVGPGPCSLGLMLHVEEVVGVLSILQGGLGCSPVIVLLAESMTGLDDLGDGISFPDAVFGVNAVKH